MGYTLITAGPSPFGRKVAVALREKGLAYDVRLDLPWSEASCTPDYSPLQQLPILLTDDATPIYDSAYILEWLEVRHPHPPLLPAEATARLSARQRQMLGERLMEVAQALILEMHRPEPSAAWVERQTRKVTGALAELERLHAARDAEAAVDLGDIAAATTLLLFEHAVAVGLSPPIDALTWRGRYPALTARVEAIEARPSFAATRPQPMELDLQATVG